MMVLELRADNDHLVSKALVPSYLLFGSKLCDWKIVAN